MTLIIILIVASSAVLSYHYNKDHYIGETLYFITSTLANILLSSILVIFLFYIKLLVEIEFVSMIVLLGITCFILLSIFKSDAWSDNHYMNVFIKTSQLLIMVFGVIPLVATVFKDWNLVFKIIIYGMIEVAFFYVKTKFFNEQIKIADQKKYRIALLIKSLKVATVVLVIMFIFSLNFMTSIRKTLNLDNYMGPLFRSRVEEVVGYEENILFSQEMDDLEVYDFYQDAMYTYILDPLHVTKYDELGTVITITPSTFSSNSTTLYNNTGGEYTTTSIIYSRTYIEGSPYVEYVKNTNENDEMQKSVTKWDTDGKNYSYSEDSIKYTKYNDVVRQNPTDSEFYINESLVDVGKSSSIVGNDFEQFYLKTYEDGTLTITEFKQIDNHRYMYLSESFFMFNLYTLIIVLVIPLDTFGKYELEKNKTWKIL